MNGLFRLQLPRLICAGDGVLNELKRILAGKKQVAVITDDHLLQIPHIQQVIRDIQAEVEDVHVLSSISPEPDIHEVARNAQAFRAWHAQVIIAIGGGSVLDTAKLLSVLDTDDYSVYDLLTAPERAKRMIPVIMIPTTAGTGAEATPNAIVAVPEQQTKIGIVNDALIGQTVLLDADMLAAIPRKIAAATGADALSHAVECFTSKKATPFSDFFAMEAFRLIEKHLEDVCSINSAEARIGMLTAAFYAGVAISASGTTGVHALSYPLGGKYHIPHGIANAVLLLPVMRFNEPACRERFALLYDRVRPGVPLKDDAQKSAWIMQRMQQIIHRIGITPSLKEYGVSIKDIDSLADAAMQVTRLLNNNLRPITRDDAISIYQQILTEEES